MNLLEKALVIQDIKHNIQIIENNSLPLFERAKATHRLKEIFQFCEKPITQKRNQSLTQFDTPQQINHDVFIKSNFQKSYRGLFQDQSILLKTLQENPLLGWATLYDAIEKRWQIWLIPQAKKGVIHSSWKTQLTDAYQWLLQQQNLLHCLVEDANFVDDAHQTSHTQRVTDSTKNQFSHLDKANTDPITHQFQQTNIQALTAEQIKIELEPFHANLTPIQIPAVTETSYLIHFDEVTHPQNLFIYLSVSSKSDDILNTPIVVAERVDEQQQFMGYVMIFGSMNPHIAIQLASQYCAQYQQQLATIKSMTWQIWQDHATNLETFFDVFLQEKTLWKPPETPIFIPRELVLTQRFIPFEEMPASLTTPLILMKERLKYRIVHGENRLQSSVDALGYPCVLFSRQDGVSWQMLRDILTTLSSPVSSDILHIAITQHVSPKGILS